MMTVRRTQSWMPGLFNEFLGNDLVQKSTEVSASMNIMEADKHYLVELAVPGLTKNDCSIRLENENELMVSVAKKQEQKQEGQPGHYLRREFLPARFERTLILPDEVGKDRIEAKVEHGVLTIRIPKIDPAEKQKLSKQICVQ